MVDDKWMSTEGDVQRFEKDGDSVEGKLVAIRDGSYYRPDGGKSRIYDIETKEGVKTIFGTMILERNMSTVEVGSEVKIIYHGLVNTKRGTQAKKFEVLTPRDKSK